MKCFIEQGMQIFDQVLYQFYIQGEIIYEDVLVYVDLVNDLCLMIKFGLESDVDYLLNLIQGLSLEIIDDDFVGWCFC